MSRLISMRNQFEPRNPALPEGRHNPSPALAEAIRKGRLEIEERRCGNYVNYRISIANMALWRRTGHMRSWDDVEIMRGDRAPALVFPQVRAHSWPLGMWRQVAEWRRKHGSGLTVTSSRFGTFRTPSLVG